MEKKTQTIKGGTITFPNLHRVMWPAPSYQVAVRWYEEMHARGFAAEVYTGGETGYGVWVWMDESNNPARAGMVPSLFLGIR